MCKVSVVIPVWNRSLTILRAVQSIKNQTIAVAEIIVVDDASTDDTIQCVQSTYPDVHIVALPYKQGAQVARARGVFEAKGEWIAFLDSDDYWLPQKLELQLQKAQQGYDVVHGPCLRVLADGSKEPFTLPPDEGDVFAALLRRPGPMYQSLLVKKRCFTVCSYPDSAILSYQEWDFALSLAQHYLFGFVPEPLFCYEVQDDSISKDGMRGILGYWQIVNKWEKFILERCGTTTLENHYSTLSHLAKKEYGIVGSLFFKAVCCKKMGTKLPIGSILQDIVAQVTGYLLTVLKKIPYLGAFLRKFKGLLFL